jgi:hypothetical protein
MNDLINPRPLPTQARQKKGELIHNRVWQLLEAKASPSLANS